MATMTRMSLILLVFDTFAGSTAWAEDVECQLAEEGVVQVDGLLDDWQGVAGLSQTGVDGERDATVTFRCNYDQDTLYFSVDVRDDLIVRGKGAEDRISVIVGPDRLDASPAYAEKKARSKSTWNGKAAKGLEVADSLQQGGWAVEAAVPLKRLRGWTKGAATLALRVDFADADLQSMKKHEEVVTTGASRIVFSEALAVYREFLRDMKLKPKDITIDMMVDMDGEPGPERVLVAGRTVGVLADQYYYMKLPPAKPKDLIDVKVVDLAGAKKHAIVAQWMEHGKVGSREVVGVFVLLRDGSFPMIWAHEITKVHGANKITNTWSLEPRTKKAKGKKKIEGQDIVVKVGDATGWTEENWQPETVEGMYPILLPWGEKQVEHWHFRGDEAYGGE
jgi:hypothetical protein